MDNPNDFIHIDEVFKRLKDNEEPVESGSWMRMKDLLDSEMPVGVPAVRLGFRRYVLPIIATLLIGGGGYTYYNINKSNNVTIPNEKMGIAAAKDMDYSKAGNNPSDIAADSRTLGNESLEHTGNDARSALQNTKFAGNTNLNHGKPPASTHSTSNNNNNKALNKTVNKTPNNQHVVTNIAGNATKSDNTLNEQTVVVLNTVGKPANNVSAKAVRQKPIENRNGTSHTVAAKNNNTNQGTVAANNAQAKAAPFETQNLVEQIYPSSSTSVLAANNTGVPKLKTVTSNFNNEKIVKDENGSFYKEERDTIKRIDMVSKSVSKNKSGAGPFTTVVDTLSVTRIERIKFTPLNKVEMASLRAANIIPMAEPIRNPLIATTAKEYTVTTEAVNLVPLANYKVASRKVDPSKFNQLVQSTSQGLSNYFDGTNKFYAAIFVGGNGLVGNPTGFGMQLGIAGIYQLNERLNLMGELKFANHYFSNYSINDQSISYENVNSLQVSGQWVFTGTRNISTTTYNVKSFSALEFPVSLNYNISTRMSVLAGVNLAYAFPAKWNKLNVNSSEAASSTQNQNQNPFINTPFVLNESSDFGGRFGMGYVAGVSYDISRKLSFDARVSQNLWTSYSGDANAINKLYKMPSFQLSLGFFFGRKDKVTYIMDRR